MEIKCPYTFRNEDLKDPKSKLPCYLFRNERGEIVLKRNSIYWHQIMGQLFITRRSVCNFIIWTLKGFLNLKIQFDTEWEKNIDVLISFYFEHVKTLK